MITTCFVSRHVLDQVAVLGPLHITQHLLVVLEAENTALLVDSSAKLTCLGPSSTTNSRHLGNRSHSIEHQLRVIHTLTELEHRVALVRDLGTTPGMQATLKQR